LEGKYTEEFRVRRSGVCISKGVVNSTEEGVWRRR